MPGPSCMLVQKHMYNVINGPTEITALYKGCRSLMKYRCMCTVDQICHNLINLLDLISEPQILEASTMNALLYSLQAR